MDADGCSNSASLQDVSNMGKPTRKIAGPARKQGNWQMTRASTLPLTMMLAMPRSLQHVGATCAPLSSWVLSTWCVLYIDSWMVHVHPAHPFWEARAIALLLPNKMCEWYIDAMMYMLICMLTYYMLHACIQALCVLCVCVCVHCICLYTSSLN